MPNIRPINLALANKAQIELNEVPERIQDDLDAIRAWIAKQPHLIARTDDQFLVTFLRACKYRMEKVKEKFENFYTIKTILPEIFNDRDPNNPILQEIIRMGVTVPLPSTATPDSPRIFLSRPGLCNPKILTPEQVLKTTTMLHDFLLMQDDNFVIAGQITIVDMKNLTMQHILNAQRLIAKQMITVVEKSYPARSKGIHFINSPSAIQSIFNLIKGFLSEKNKQRVFVHGDNLETLYEHVPKHLLPTEYGGDAGPIQNIIDDWVQTFKMNRNWFLEEEKYKPDERKRLSGPKTDSTQFGSDGSFRSLQID